MSSSSRKSIGTSRQIVVSRLARRRLSPHAAIFSPCRPLIEATLSRIRSTVPPLLHQFAGRLLANARDPRNIVRGVAPQGEDVAHEHRIVDAVFLADGLAVHDLDRPVGALLLVDAAVFAHQLTVVLVGRHHVDVVAGRSPLLREGADHVVGLIALDFENRDAHGFEHPLDVGHRDEYVLRSFGAVGLVFGEDLAAETAPLGIERHAQQVGALALLDVAEELHEAEDHRGVHSVAVAHRAAQEGVIVLEEQRVGVYQEEFFFIAGLCVFPPSQERGTYHAGLSSANHSANDVAVSWSRSEWSRTPSGRREAMRRAKSASMFSHVG